MAASLLLATGGCGSNRTKSTRVEGMPPPVLTTLDGAGTSSPLPLYKRWFKELANQGVKVSYQSESERDALANIDLGPALTRMDHNPRVGYPLVTFVWILLYKTGNGPTDQASLNKVFGYALSEPAQALAEPLGYVSLPQPLLEKSRAALATIQP